jgi:hypothetical protein
MVRVSGTDKSGPAVREFTTVEETARYGPVCLVVWEDGDREVPSYPIK